MLSYPHILFLDTETSGKPKNIASTDVKEWPYIVQASWAVYDNKGGLIHKTNVFIKAQDYQIEKMAMKIHGITEEMVNAEGVSRKEALNMLAKDIRRYKPLIVGHFIELDLKMIQMAANRAGMKNFISGVPSFCTMHATSDYMNFRDRHYPQLGEIYQMLFKKRLEGAHDARVDVQATSDVFFELVRKGEVTSEVIKGQDRTNDSRKKPAGCARILVIILLLSILHIWIQ